MILRRKFLAAAALLSSFASTQAAPSSSGKSIIVYFSRTGHIKSIAEKLSSLTGAPLLLIEPVEPYPSAYSETTEIVQDQMRKGVVPPIRPLNIDWSQYDTIYVGSPTWWGHISCPVHRFLQDNDFCGKTIRLFTSHGGSGVASPLNDVRSLQPNAAVPESIAFYGSGMRPEQMDRSIITEALMKAAVLCGPKNMQIKYLPVLN